MSVRTRRNWARRKGKVYSNKLWKGLKRKLLYGKVCAICKSVLATQLHHKVSPFKDPVTDYKLAFDPDNVQPLCGECHKELHRRERITKVCDYCSTDLKDGICIYCQEIKDD